MRSWILIGTIFGLALLNPNPTRAQSTSVSGQVTSSDGSPWGGLEIQIVNTSTGEHYSVKTGKDGRYSQWGLRPGVYKISLVDPKNASFAYSEAHTLHGAAENDVSINFGSSSQSPSAVAHTPDEEDAKQFAIVKSHFNAGAGAMYDAQTLRAQLATASADHVAEIQTKLAADYRSAVGEFEQAQQVDPRLNTTTQAMIWSHLADAYDFAGDTDSAISSYQKAIALAPEAVDYQNLAKLQAGRAVQQKGSSEMERAIADANAACDQAATLDRATGAKCWANIGAILSNNAQVKIAATAWRNAATLDPTNAEVWFQLGRSLLEMAQFRRDGEKVIETFPDGTGEALHKCIDADPNGPYARQAKELLDEFRSTQTPNAASSADQKK